ncbi:hypothetical protein CU669_11850 [Paramagnetospirillum kuznetsovii]|uniref:Uncharacterized protein n=1 Tax=Paramagnetospirillum kuznetsovii TaxID=2053833 RepID=A0A364NX97_9PROT|nr:hypothetical protein CU669_11850 [Paramagnetospirillum kuznetsovii]
MCEIFDQAPPHIKAAVLPILSEMHTANLIAAYAILENQQGTDRRLLREIRRWVKDSCRYCDICQAA